MSSAATETTSGRGEPSAPKLSSLLSGMRDHIAALAREVDATKQSAGFRAALDAMAKFWRYSANNQWLIQHACPHASHVAGKRTWAELGRTVVGGAKPIVILAPTRGRFPFIAVEVFDISQTEGEPVPELELSLEGDRAPVHLLERAAQRLGIRIVDHNAPRHLGTTVLGLSCGGEVRIAPGLSPLERLSVLAHELAHELLHQGEREAARARPRSVAEEETEAEAVSYVVLKSLGLPSTAPTYIAWRGGDGGAVMRSLRRVQRAARAILEAAYAERTRASQRA